ncbi:MAG: hypothetical protein R3F61_12880 [Myxococcota bacterium]
MRTLSNEPRDHLRTPAHHGGAWTRTSHEKVSFWLEPDELATEVDTEVEDVTEPSRGPDRRPSPRTAAPSPRAPARADDDLPTLQVERRSFLDDAVPTHPDVRRVITVLRRRAGVTGRPSPQSPQAANRSTATPMAAPQRHVIHARKPEHRQVQVERPAARPLPSQHAVIQRGPVTLNVDDARDPRAATPHHVEARVQAPAHPVAIAPTMPAPALEAGLAEVSLTREYGWWFAGIVLGGAFGTVLSGLALTAAVIW